MKKMHAERSAAPLLRRGDLVEVFQRPITDEESEGTAFLVRPITDADPATGAQDWVVRFLWEDWEYQRTIYPRHRRA